MRTFIAAIAVVGLGWVTAAGAATPYSVSGQITFVGRVLNPTCAVHTVRATAESAAAAVQGCAGALDAQAKSVTAFTTEAIRLASAADLRDDGMLHYLVKNLPAGQQAQLVTRTYR